MITGFLVTGMVCGPHLLGLISAEAVSELGFVNDLALAFIAFAAGSELFLKDIRTRIRSIAWNTFGQLVVTFIFSSVAVYLLADYVPFMSSMSHTSRVAVSILVATIFIARSPSSAIAVINEMRAKGPFTQVSIGVTVIKDVLVILLFAVCFSMSRALIAGEEMHPTLIAVLLSELLVALILGYILGKAITLVFSIRLNTLVKGGVALLMGYGVFYLAHFVADHSTEWISTGFHFEPLLTCIIASFQVTNYSKFRAEFQTFLEGYGPAIYVAFFTLTGAVLSINVLQDVWVIALILFGVRMVALILGSFAGASLAGDPPLFRRIGWMPFVTQAGVGLGLAAEIANEFPLWGTEFASIIIAVIVLNQFVGPPLFKWAIMKVGEAHTQAKSPDFDGVRDAFIFGCDDQGWALARQLSQHQWNVEMVSMLEAEQLPKDSELKIHRISGPNLEDLERMNIRKGDAIILLLSDEQNLEISQLIFEKIGTKEIVVRLNDHKNFDKFHELGALIVEPSTAIVSLLDQFVRSPVAASLLLGTDKNQHTLDVEVRDKDMHGMFIRDLRLPMDTIILSIKRGNEVIITHGYTRLRMGDIVSVVGSTESLDKIQLQFESI